MLHRLPFLIGASVFVGCVAEPHGVTDAWDAESEHDHAPHAHPAGELPEVHFQASCIDLDDPGHLLDYCVRLSPEEPELYEDEPRFGDLESVRLPAPASGQSAIRCGAFNLIGGPSMLPVEDDLLLAYCDQDLIGGTRLVHIGAEGLATSTMVKERACLATPAGVALGTTPDGTEVLFTTPTAYAATVDADGVPGLPDVLGHDDTFGVGFLDGRRLEASIEGDITDLDSGQRVARDAGAWGTSDDGLLATCTDGVLTVRDDAGGWVREIFDTGCRPLSPISLASSEGSVAAAFRSQSSTGRLVVWDGPRTTTVALADYPVVVAVPDGFATIADDARFVRWDLAGEWVAERRHPHVASAQHVEHLDLVAMDGDAVLTLVDRRFWADDIHYYAYDVLEVSRMAVP